MKTEQQLAQELVSLIKNNQPKFQLAGNQLKIISNGQTFSTSWTTSIPVRDYTAKFR